MSTVDVIETVKIKGTHNMEHELSTTTAQQCVFLQIEGNN